MIDAAPEERVTRCPRCHRRLCARSTCPQDGAAAPPVRLRNLPGPDLTLLALPGYTLGGTLGAGGFGLVLAARRDRDGLESAIKIAHSPGPASARRFAREAEALACLGAPIVPALLERGCTGDGRPYLVLERLSGPTLAARLAGLPAPPALPWLGALCDAVLESVAVTHRCGFVHCDLKPENVFLSRRPMRARLIDFGLAQKLDDPEGALAAYGSVLGTPEYMAPEQLRGAGAADVRTDVYALGVLLYELLTLRPPFVGARALVEHGHLALRPRPPSALAPVPRALEELVLACLAKQPCDRPRDVHALRQALASALRKPCPRAAAPTPPPTADPAVPLPPGAGSADGLRPVVMLLVETTAPVTEVASALRAHGGSLARCRGQWLCGLFRGVESEDPAAAARAAAAKLLAQGATRAALHLAEVGFRRGADGAERAYGSALDQPATWLPEKPWSGLLVTAQAARLLREPATDPPLFGREALVSALQASWAQSCVQGPVLCTLLGERGLGRSRMAAQAATLALGATVIRLCARPPQVADPGQVVRDLLRAVAGDPGQPAAAGSRHAVTQTIGEGLRGLAQAGPVAVVLDDAHFADDATLDALEYATRPADGAAPKLWVCVLALPRLAELRPGFGQRAALHHRLELRPLGPAHAQRLAAWLLAPVERPPAALLARLDALCAGNPADLVELAHGLKREGIVRAYPGSDAFYVATDELAELPSSPVGSWLAARELAALPRELAELARLCAVLGPELDRDEVAGVQRGLEAAQVELADPQVGLARLAHRGLLVEAEEGTGRYRFRREVLQEAIYGLGAPPVRAHLHRQAFAYWRAQPLAAAPRRLHRLAHHGARGGFPDQAATCLLALAEAARARHAHAEAEAHFTSALPLLPDPGPARMQALKGRGEARWRLMHFEDALSDFQAARALAANLHDLCAEVELLALESAVCDFCDRRAEAAALIETAHRRAPAELPPRVQARLANWLGVARHRAQRWSEAIELLSQAAALGDALGDHDTKVGSMLLLAYDLGRSGRADEGARLLDQVIAICERTCDVFHLATALTNRVELWRDRKQPARAIADLERAIRLGNQFGLDYVETAGTINLAELQLWQGDLAAAVASAERAHRSACKRFRDRPLPVVSLYYAHLLAHAGRLSEARAVAESAGVGEAELSEPMIALLPPCLRLATGGGSEAEWDALIERARRDAISEQLVEIMWLRGKCALRQHSPAAATRALAAALAEARRLSSALSGPIEADLACAQTMHTRTPTRTLVRAA